MTDLQYLVMLLGCSLIAWGIAKWVNQLLDMKIRRQELKSAYQKVEAKAAKPPISHASTSIPHFHKWEP